MFNNIKYFLNLAGLNNADLARLMKTTPVNISRWISGEREPSIAVLHKIAKYLNCTAGELIDDIDKSRRATNIPITGCVGAGGHIELYIDESPDAKEVECPPEYNPDNTLAFKVDGDSMLPEYKDGAIVFCRKEPPDQIENCLKRDCIVLLEDDTNLLKNVQRDKDGSIILVSYNNAYPPIKDIKIKDIRKIGTIKYQ